MVRSDLTTFGAEMKPRKSQLKKRPEPLKWFAGTLFSLWALVIFLSVETEAQFGLGTVAILAVTILVVSVIVAAIVERSRG